MKSSAAAVVLGAQRDQCPIVTKPRSFGYVVELNTAIAGIGKSSFPDKATKPRKSVAVALVRRHRWYASILRVLSCVRRSSASTFALSYLTLALFAYFRAEFIFIRCSL